MTRDEALEKLEQPPYDAATIHHDIEFVANKLGISVDELLGLPGGAEQVLSRLPVAGEHLCASGRRSCGSWAWKWAESGDRDRRLWGGQRRGDRQHLQEARHRGQARRDRRRGFAAADRIILPGVGCVRLGDGAPQPLGLRAALERAVLEERKPMLGICVGMQMLARGSEEGRLAGFGWIDGDVKRFESRSAAAKDAAAAHGLERRAAGRLGRSVRGSRRGRAVLLPAFLSTSRRADTR